MCSTNGNLARKGNPCAQQKTSAFYHTAWSGTGPVQWWTSGAACLKIWYVGMFCIFSSPPDTGAYSSNGKSFSSTCFMCRLLHQRHFCKEGQSLFSTENLCASSCFIMSCCLGHYTALYYGGQTVHERHASGFWYVMMFHEFLAPRTEVPTRAIARGFLGYTDVVLAITCSANSTSARRGDPRAQQITSVLYHLAWGYRPESTSSIFQESRMLRCFTFHRFLARKTEVLARVVARRFLEHASCIIY